MTTRLLIIRRTYVALPLKVQPIILIVARTYYYCNNFFCFSASRFLVRKFIFTPLVEQGCNHEGVIGSVITQSSSIREEHQTSSAVVAIEKILFHPQLTWHAW